MDKRITMIITAFLLISPLVFAQNDSFVKKREDEIRKQMQDHKGALESIDAGVREKMVTIELIKSRQGFIKSILQVLANASEQYARVNKQVYPTHMTPLVHEGEFGLNEDYCDRVLDIPELFGEALKRNPYLNDDARGSTGFKIECDMSSDGYTFIATPENINYAGNTGFLMKTGHVLETISLDGNPPIEEVMAKDEDVQTASRKIEEALGDAYKERLERAKEIEKRNREILNKYDEKPW